MTKDPFLLWYDAPIFLEQPLDTGHILQIQVTFNNAERVVTVF